MVTLTPSAVHSLKTTAVERGGGGHTEGQRKRGRERKKRARACFRRRSFVLAHRWNSLYLYFFPRDWWRRQKERESAASEQML